jgi:hypothetical protein
MSFAQNTRRKVLNLGLRQKAAASPNPLVWDIPKTGLLAGIYVNITGTIAGALGALNPLGKASIVRRVRLIANSGIDLINISGPGYHYLLRDNLEGYADPVPQSDARAVVAAAAFDVSMYLPITINSRDPLGLFMLQNEATLLQLSIEFETDASVAVNAVVTANVTPFIEVFTVPARTEDWPPLNIIHQIVEETRAIPAAGMFEYKWPRGNTYAQVLHAAGIASAAPADNWTTAALVVNQSDVLWSVTPGGLGMEYSRSHGRVRLLGTIPIDLLGTSGLGCFGSARDMLYSAMVTEISTQINAVAPGTFYTLRRQLVALKG